jgi:hypothetical protein
LYPVGAVTEFEAKGGVVKPLAVTGAMVFATKAEKVLTLFPLIC